MKGKTSIKFNQGLKASMLLIENDYFREATILLWITIRDLIFENLFLSNVGYNSTREAMRKFLIINQYDSELITDVLTFERISTLSEWDETFNVTSDDISILLHIHSRLSTKIVTNGTS